MKKIKKTKLFTGMTLGLMVASLLFFSGCGGDVDDFLNKLRVKKDGDGFGLVTSLPSGIDCGGDCSQYFAEGDKVTLKAVAEPESVFAGWTGGGCSGTGDCTVTIDGSETVTATFNLAGTFYRTRGNGFIIEILGDQYNWYEVTSKSLFHMAEGDIRDGVIYYNGYPAMTLDYLLSMSDEIEELPLADITAPTDDPVDNFEIFWRTFDEYYSFFDIPEDLDWQAVYDLYAPMVDRNTTEDDLWEILTEMIAPLNDGHTRLFDIEGMRMAESRPESTSPSYWMLENQEAYIGALAAVLDGFSVEENFTGNGKILFGTIDNRIGYLNILSFSGYAEIDMEDLSVLSGFCESENDRETFEEVMDEVFSAFSDMESLVIDLRFNRGGSGDRVKELTSRLVSESRPLYYYQVRAGAHGEFDDPVFVYAEPEGVPFLDKPIVVLTSGNTISGGDAQAMMLKSLPNATIMGETTFGIFSEGILRMLPNGWIFTLSTQRLYTPTGEFYEQKGIAPDIEVLPDPDELLAGNDNMLAAALAHIESLLSSD